MSDTIQDLLNENLQQVQTLLTSATTMLEGAERIQEYGRNVAQSFEQQEQEMTESIDRIDQRLRTLAKRLHSQEVQWRQWTNQLTTIGDGLEESIDEAASGLHANLLQVREEADLESSIQSTKDAIESSLESVTEGSRQAKDELEQGCATLCESAGTRAQESRDITTKVTEHRELFVAGFEAARSAIEQSIDEATTKASTLLDDHGSRSEAFIQHLMEKTNAALQGVGETLPSEIAQSHASSEERVGASMDDVVGGIEGNAEQVLSRLDELPGPIEDVVQVVKKIEPVVDLIKTLL
jgi:chromosome segregation ATPase